MNLNSNLISILRGIVKNLIESVVFFFYLWWIWKFEYFIY